MHAATVSAIANPFKQHIIIIIIHNMNNIITICIMNNNESHSQIWYFIPPLSGYCCWREQTVEVGKPAQGSHQIFPSPIQSHWFRLLMVLSNHSLTQVLTGTLDYLRDVVGMQLSQFPLPDINKVIIVSFDQIELVLFWASTRQACLPACRFPTECHPATVINGPADFLICEWEFSNSQDLWWCDSYAHHKCVKTHLSNSESLRTEL